MTIPRQPINTLMILLAMAATTARAEDKYIFNATRKPVVVTFVTDDGIKAVTLDHGMTTEVLNKKLIEIRFYFENGREILYPASFGINSNMLFMIKPERIARYS